MTPIKEGGVMTAWTPPSFRYYRQPDGTFTILDEKGNTVPSPPTMKYVPANGDSKVLDPWGNDVPEYVPTYPNGLFVHKAADGTLTAVDEHGVPLPFPPDIKRIVNGDEQILTVLPDGSAYEPQAYEFPEEFFIHTAADGSMTAVDASGVPLPTQPTMGHGGAEMVAESDYAVLPDGTAYEPPAYEFPEEFFIHTAADGSMTAVDASGVPLPTQPTMGHGGAEMVAESDYAVLPDGTAYEPQAYEFPEEFFIHTAADGSMTAVDASGVPLPTQPTMGHGGAEMVAESDYAVLPDGTAYEPQAYEFPEEFFIHTAADGSMTAVDASGVPLPTQPTMGHGGAEMVAESDYAVLPDGTAYEPPPLYPPAGETPEIWPPDPWPPEYVKAPVDEDTEPDEVVGADSADDQDAAADAADEVQQVDSDEPASDEATEAPPEETTEAPPPASDPLRSYSGVELVEGEVLLDDDLSDTDTAVEMAVESPSSDLLTVGLVDEVPGKDEMSATPIPLPDDVRPLGAEVVSATPIPLPDDVRPLGAEVVSATPIPLPDDVRPLGAEVVSATPIPLPDDVRPLGAEVVSATPIPLPDEAMPVGDEASVLSIPIPAPPTAGSEDAGEVELDDTGDDQIALDRKGGDIPVDISVDETSADVAVEFRVEVVEEVQVEEVLLEDVELETIEPAEPIVELEELALDEEGIDELDT